MGKKTTGRVQVPGEAMDEWRSLGTAIYANESEGMLKRVIEKVNDARFAILRTPGYELQDGELFPN